MSKSKVTYSILAILFGAFIFVYGGYDDSPGAQGLGLLIAITGTISTVKDKNKNSG